MTRLLLIRHATNHTVGKRFSGRTAGIHLNEDGLAQAQKLADRLSGIPIHAIYSSPMERAVETAKPIAQSQNRETIICDDFLEIDTGEWTNRTFEEMADDPKFRLFNSFRSCTRIPGGESMLEAQMRIITGLEKLSLKHQQETVVVVSHADMIKAAVAYYAGIHLDLFQRIEISPASLSIIDLYEETARILLLNDTGALPKY